jgi:hypothetical protein
VNAKPITRPSDLAQRRAEAVADTIRRSNLSDLVADVIMIIWGLK